jgi:hypothetical protein
MIAKRMTPEKIERSEEVQEWLTQFSDNDVLTAASLLCRLQFISRDEYSNWLLTKLRAYLNLNSVAVYAVRKFKKTAQCLWQKNNNTQPRPAQTQGSEDLISSVISNANRRHNNFFLDHPSLTVLKDQKIRNIILIDDSIGSGKRVADFIQLMTNNKTFMSWWSGGYISLHILSYVRTRQSEKYILDRTSGSDHGNRKIRLSSKLKFDSDLIYEANDIQKRWGKSSDAILSLCSSIKKIPKDRRKGFGYVMGNIVFYHSVPNNIPGILVCANKGWIPLFPNRSLPDWASRLLKETEVLPEITETRFDQLQISNSMVDLLEIIKRGLRTRASLSRRLDCDESITQKLVKQAIQFGFVSPHLRILQAGQDYLHKKQKKGFERKLDYSLYIPQSWCADQGTVQPSDHDAKARVQTDSIAFKSMDGDDGESFLERTDAKATTSPVMNVAQYPSWARERHIHNGPKGLKE